MEQIKKFGAWVLLPATIILAIIWRIATQLNGAKQELARRDAKDALGNTLGKLAEAQEETKDAQSDYDRALAAFNKSRES